VTLVKTLLGIGSAATLVLLIAAAAQENYFAEWRDFQREYRGILLEKADSEGSMRAARGFSVEIRQIVSPDLETVDRCVTCHLGLDDPRMSDQPQPFTAHPGDLLDTHEMDSFGCTFCHLGQGRATTKREAHAVESGVFWEHAMLPATFAQSTCGICHDPEHLRDRGAPALAAGLDRFRSDGCLGCHKLGGRGGVLGTALDHIGDKTSHAMSFAHLEGPRHIWNWHREHLRAPQNVVPGSQMPPLDAGEGGLNALTSYLLSLRETNLTERMTPADRHQRRYRIWHVPPLSGADLYQQFCRACHGDGLETVFHDTLGVAIPSIRHPDLLAVVDADFFVESTRQGRPGTLMPAWGPEGGGLTDEELTRLAAYLLASRTETREISFRMSDDPDPANGELLFDAECTACHSLTREGTDAPWLGSPGFQATYSDELIGHTIRWGRTDTLMIGYGEEADGEYTEQEISDLVAFIRSLG
jgi:mono/diheme cytochrome c family protein